MKTYRHISALERILTELGHVAYGGTVEAILFSIKKKNKKLKRLKAIHPDVNCKLFYQRDYLNLVVKYGLEEPDHLDDVVAPTRMPGRPEITRLEDRGERLTG